MFMLLSRQVVKVVAVSAFVLANGNALRGQPVTTIPATAPAAGRAIEAVVVVEPAKVVRWGDLLRVRLHEGKLEVVCDPPLDIAGQLARGKAVEVELEDASDRFWRVKGIVSPARAAGQPAPAAAARKEIDFVATARARGRGGERPAPSTVMLMQGVFRLSGRWLRDEKVLDVSFVSYTDRPNVSLRVRELTRGRRLAAPLVLEANDIQQLRHDHPAEVRTYLDAMLGEIGGGSNPLRPQAGDVYRAFDNIPADSATLEQVTRLLEDLDALEPATREAASRRLERLGRAGVLAAARINRTDLSAEQALRLDAFIARNITIADAASARDDPLFLLDCLEDEDRAVRSAALEQLRRVTGRAIDFDIDAPASGRAAAADSLAKEFAP